MKRLLILVSFLISGLVFTAFAQPGPPECRGQRECKPGPECCGPQGPGGMGFMDGPGPMPMRREMMQERRMQRMRMMHEDGTLMTVRGRVVSIEARRGGVCLMVESESRLLPVILGPGWGRPDQERKVERNDMVEITGKRMMRDGQPVIMAEEIKLSDHGQEITLRPMRKGPFGPPRAVAY